MSHLDLPRYATPLHASGTERSGDPLGHTAACTQLYDSVFPGINNYVRYIGLYSAICWAAWVVDNSPECEGLLPKEKERRFHSLREKVELFVVLANPGARHLPGSSRLGQVGRKKIELQFDTFGDKRISAFDSKYYGPSIKTGLRFLEVGDDGRHRCSSAGTKLAEAFDAKVKGKRGYKILRSLSEFRTSRSAVQDVLNVLKLDKPSAAEKTAFLATFFPVEAPDEGSAATRREGLLLALDALDVLCTRAGTNGSSLSEVRALMARGFDGRGNRLAQDDTSSVQARWAVLQMKKLQKLSLEVMLCAIERWLDTRLGLQAMDAKDCARHLAAAANRHWGKNATLPLSKLLHQFELVRGDAKSLFEIASRQRKKKIAAFDTSDLFGYVDMLEDPDALAVQEDGTSTGMAQAMYALVFCAAEVGNLMRLADYQEVINGEVDRCGLKELHGLVQAYESRPIEALFTHLLESYVVERHYEVAFARMRASSDEGVLGRFIFLEGDFGLERVDSSQAFEKPRIVKDRLLNALELSCQAGLVARCTPKGEEARYSLTSLGRQRICQA